MSSIIITPILSFFCILRTHLLCSKSREGARSEECMSGGERAQTLRIWKGGFERKAVTSGWWLIVGLGVFSLFHLSWIQKGQTRLLLKCGLKLLTVKCPDTVPGTYDKKTAE